MDATKVAKAAKPVVYGGSQKWPHRFEHESGDDKWNAAGLIAAQGCPWRRAGVACDERTTDAVGIPC
jgi:hypothetical protein